MRDVDSDQGTLGPVDSMDDSLHELLLRNDPMRMSHKIREKIKFQSSQRQDSSIGVSSETFEVHTNGPAMQRCANMRAISQAMRVGGSLFADGLRAP
jgi:hypothetical protein